MHNPDRRGLVDLLSEQTGAGVALALWSHARCWYCLVNMPLPALLVHSGVARVTALLLPPTVTPRQRRRRHARAARSASAGYMWRSSSARVGARAGAARDAGRLAMAICIHGPMMASASDHDLYRTFMNSKLEFYKVSWSSCQLAPGR